VGGVLEQALSQAFDSRGRQRLDRALSRGRWLSSPLERGSFAACSRRQLF
jgi:hypothetical protein